MTGRALSAARAMQAEKNVGKRKAIVSRHVSSRGQGNLKERAASSGTFSGNCFAFLRQLSASLNVHINIQQIRIELVRRMLRLKEQPLEACAESIIRFYEGL